MKSKTILLIGGPDAGKTNYFVRLWRSLAKGDGVLSAPNLPEDITYVEDGVRHLLAGEFAPRTQEKGISGTLEITIEGTDQVTTESSIVRIPDVKGEEWQDAVYNRDLKPEIGKALREADGAFLFVRILSSLNEAPLDWVTAQQLLALPFAQEKPSGKMPTQVCLCELLSFLEATKKETTLQRKVAVMITGWDRLDENRASKGPMAFLEDEYPMFAGKIMSKSSLKVKVYGVSIVGGDLEHDEEFKDKFRRQNLNETGYIVQDLDGDVDTTKDITEPLGWLLTDKAHEPIQN